jgi:hypothetical protein
MKVKFTEVKFDKGKYLITAEADGVKHLHVVPMTAILSKADDEGIQDGEALDALLKTPHGPDADVEALADDKREPILKGLEDVRKIQQAGSSDRGRASRSSAVADRGKSGRDDQSPGMADRDRRPARTASRRRVGARKHPDNGTARGAGSGGPQAHGPAPQWII